MTHSRASESFLSSFRCATFDLEGTVTSSCSGVRHAPSMMWGPQLRKFFLKLSQARVAAENQPMRRGDAKRSLVRRTRGSFMRLLQNVVAAANAAPGFRFRVCHDGKTHVRAALWTQRWRTRLIGGPHTLRAEATHRPHLTPTKRSDLLPMYLAPQKSPAYAGLLF